MPSNFQESIEKSMVAHPWRWGTVSFIIVGLPQWLSGTFALWSDEPLFKVVARNLNMNEIPFSPSWITIPIGLGMFAYLAFALKNRQVNDPPKPISDPPKPPRQVLVIKAKPQALLKIDYKYEEVPNEGFFNWFTDEQGKNFQRYRVRIRNISSAPIQEVEVKLETIEGLKDEMCGVEPIWLRQVGYPLTFDKSGSRVIKIHGNDSEWVSVLLYERQIFGHVSVAGIDKRVGGVDTEGKIMSPHNPHRIKIVARGAGVKEDVAFFFVRTEAVGGSERLIMKQLES